MLLKSNINPMLWMLLLLSTLSCEPSQTALPERGHAPWVFRSVLDGQPRMLTVALHDDLWLAYSAQTGALYKAWRGGVELDGAVYTTAHGPQPTSFGKGWLKNAYENPWRLEIGDQQLKPTIQYRGHVFRDGQVFINTELAFENGEMITVSERPEFAGSDDQQTGLERTFFVDPQPREGTLLFLASAQSLPYDGSLQTNGEWVTERRKAFNHNNIRSVNLDGHLRLHPSEPTVLKTTFVKYPLLPQESADEATAQLVSARPLGARLIERSGCKTCHNQIVSTIGPAYVDVAERYRNTEDNVAMLVGKVVNGGAGNWGEAAMTPHDHLPESNIRTMVKYIMDLDAGSESAMASMASTVSSSSGENALPPVADIEAAGFQRGAVVEVFQREEAPQRLDDFNWERSPDFAGIIPEIDISGGDFGDLTDNFGLQITGYLRIPATNNYLFRLTSDDGSRLFINGDEILTNDGLHGAIPVDAEIELQEGYHPFRIDYFESAGGQSLRFQWRSFSNPEWTVVPTSAIFHRRTEAPPMDGSAPLGGSTKLAGDGSPVAGVHPSFTLSQARPDGFSPKVGGMDFLSDGRMVISTWDAEGAVYVLDGVQTGDPSQITYEKIATGLAEPLGLKVVEDTIYVLQKQELTKLIDHDEDGIIDEYRTLSNNWLVSANFHEFAFGLAYASPYFYCTLAIGILPGGASAPNQPKDRGKVLRVHEATGETRFVANGLRTPNGIGFGVDEELFVADNQGDWLPSSKILHVSEGAFFNSFAVDSAANSRKTVKKPAVWLPQDEIGNSPTTPLAIEVGPYAGQMIHGEVTHGGVKRVFMETVEGNYQGAVFRFIQGLEAGVNRMVWGPDSALYVGGIGSTGNWQHTGKLWYGLQRLAYNGQPTFEMLAVRAKSDGVEIEFTEPLADGLGGDPTEYDIQQWRYEPTPNYGGPKLDQERLSVAGVHLSEDRKRLFLELPDMKANRVVYVHLPSYWTSSANREIWSTEAWYTMNAIPTDNPGFRRPILAPAPNTLTAAERAENWELLFDGKTTKGWHRYGTDTVGSDWKVANGVLYLDVSQRPAEGSKEFGGDIVTNNDYSDFELRLEWRISACGNSGIFYYVVESDRYEEAWFTGPEMQILDNTCHPDATIPTHRAGDLYDMISAEPETVKPAGSWNRVRLVSKGGLVEHWLNGKKVVTYDRNSPEYVRMIAESKFKDLPGWGTAPIGRIALQDHDNRVEFRNIKIRRFE